MLLKTKSLEHRYTACGGIFNQHYSHLAAISLAILLQADAVIWPPMQERSSFAKRYHPDPDRNVQTWEYLDAETIWNLGAAQRNFKSMPLPLHIGVPKQAFPTKKSKQAFAWITIM